MTEDAKKNYFLAVVLETDTAEKESYTKLFVICKIAI